MDEQLAASLIASIANDRLVVMVGAGLSMDQPSDVPTAADLADYCATEYERVTGLQLQGHMHSNLNDLADHFINIGEFQANFIQTLVPWPRFMNRPNPGHEAIADFLGCAAIEFAVSTNFDILVEAAARNIGEEDFYAWVKRSDVNRAGVAHAPLIKLHGCCRIDRDNTVWSTSQLGDQPIERRIQALRNWLGGQLIQRDILILGYWSDWEYLNEIFTDTVSDYEPRHAIVVNPSDQVQLEQKAPNLWAWANSATVRFEHVQMNAAEFLIELRRHFSHRYIVRVIEQSVETYEGLFNQPFTGAIEFDAEMPIAQLYAKRRDFTGVTANEIVREKRPGEHQNRIGAMHLFLIEQGASIDGSIYNLNGIPLRLLDGSGILVSKVKERYASEPPGLIKAETTICVGALLDGNAPMHLFRKSETKGIMRPSIAGDWITDEEFLQQFGDEDDESA